MRFIEFCDEIINVSLIETIWKRTVSLDYSAPHEICIGSLKNRDLMNDPHEVWFSEAYKTRAEQEKRYSQLKKILCTE